MAESDLSGSVFQYLFHQAIFLKIYLAEVKTMIISFRKYCKHPWKAMANDDYFMTLCEFGNFM
jgi:hypothetical protein